MKDDINLVSEKLQAMGSETKYKGRIENSTHYTIHV
jgi:hypothetical protein